MRLALGLLATSCTLVLFHCSSLPDPCRGAECGVAPDGSSSEGGADGGGDVVVPEGCDPSAEPKDSPKCVDDGFGVFADATGGSDSNAGTKTSPVKSVGSALGKLGNRSRVYVCAGTYEESVKVTGAVAVYGGFACGSWTYGGGETKVSPKDAGYALEVGPVPGAVSVHDVTFSSKDGTAPGESSIAMFVHDSPQVTLRRVTARAGKGVAASDAPSPATNLFSEAVADLEGTTAAAGTAGGGAKTCACKLYGSSAGGKGGSGGNPGGNGDPGTATPAATAMPPRTSLGGDGYTAVSGQCFAGKAGPDGLGRAAGAGAARLGELTSGRWQGAAGGAGEASNPGGGGGGGGGGIANGSGGGGCGGCGGAGGVGGKAGGSSVALASYASTVKVEASVLVSADAGKGGAGSAGGAGGVGGGAGGGACGGGYGGNGAGGGGGGGGAGGVSAVLVSSKGAVILDAETQAQAKVGAKGLGGGAGGASVGGTNPLGSAPGGPGGTGGKEGASQVSLDVTP